MMRALRAWRRRVRMRAWMLGRVRAGRRGCVRASEGEDRRASGRLTGVRTRTIRRGAGAIVDGRASRVGAGWRVCACGAMVAISAVGGGCSSVGGYSFESSFSEDVRTVSVPIFINETSEPGLEIMLTEAVIKEIQSRTPWRVADDAVADTRLEGRIRSASYRRLSRTTGIGLSQEVALELSVDFDWTRSRTGESLASRQSLEGLGTFVPTRGVDERLEIGQLGAMQSAARRIVDEMRASW